jgi:4'-phosphopantetheinyl transferase EntD
MHKPAISRPTIILPLAPTLTAESCGFISQCQSVNLADFSGHCVSCQFDIEQYSDGLFHHFNIPLPASLALAVNKRKAEFLAGRFCAKQALNMWGITQAHVPIGQHRAPQWPAGVCGAITHNHTQQATALCAVSREARGVGIDLESILEAGQAAILAPNIINSAERELIMNLGIGDVFPTWLTLIFSAKESLFKALYSQVGDYFDFLDVELTHINTQQQCVALSLNRDLGSSLDSGQSFIVYYQIVNSQVLTHMEHIPDPALVKQFGIQPLR